jgi:hypothetical protein
MYVFRGKQKERGNLRQVRLSSIKTFNFWRIKERYRTRQHEAEKRSKPDKRNEIKLSEAAKILLSGCCGKELVRATKTELVSRLRETSGRRKSTLRNRGIEALLL